MRKIHPFLLVFIIFLASCAQFTSSQNDEANAKKTEKQRSTEAKIEKNDFRLPSDSPLLKGEGGFNLQDMLGFEPAENYSVNSILYSLEYSCSDLNGDNILNISDIVILINIILE